ncbi:nucleoside-diphosphate kinase [Vaginisenegalia massiliensis]|uniref:nucleoside-diphosphate kinase n=1 Tax=Vaginisenegalia massiliensis TaxID=2058294 RepID=UPI0019CFC0E9|nr:nucleoside-diphosphate kinase [Vaginisenegalia massiliensis]
MEQTYIMLKPDALERGLMGQVLSRIENKGYKIVKAELKQLGEDLIKEHYAHIADKPFFPELAAFMTRGPVLALVVEGDNVVEGMRTLMGPTNIKEAQPGTIRGDFATNMTENVIHGSDSTETAQIEIKRFFG